MVQEELMLTGQARSLDPDALAELHARHYDAVYRYVSFRVHGERATENLTHEVFERVLDALQDGRGMPPLLWQEWLYGIARDVLSSYYRNTALPTQAQFEQLESNAADHPNNATDRARARASVQAAIKALAGDQQEALALRYGWRLPVNDVAAALGESEEAVSVLLARAIATLSRRVPAGGTGG